MTALLSRGSGLGNSGLDAGGQGDSELYTSRFLIRSVVMCSWFLMLCSIEFVDRHSPKSIGSLDFIALLKLSSRFATFLTCTYVLIRSWSASGRQRSIFLLPFGIYLAWAFTSVLWSALKAITAGQAFSLLVVWYVAVAIAFTWRSRDDSRKIIASLCLALLVYSSLMLLSFVLMPSSKPGRFAFSLAHPSTVGSTASLGLLLVLCGVFIWNWSWSIWMLIPSCVIHGAVMMLAMDRTAIAILVATATPMLFLFAPRVWLATGVLAMSCLGAVYVALDGGLVLTEPLVEGSVDSLTRGQTTDQLAAFSGRQELWEKMWASYCKSPWVGHGYFVTSAEGKIEVWREETNYTAHNTLFQVLVTTGLIGLTLFLLSWLPLTLKLLRAILRTDDNRRRWAVFALIVAVWTIGWGMLDSGIVLQTLPPTVAVFAILGCTAGELSAAAPASSEEAVG